MFESLEPSQNQIVYKDSQIDDFYLQQMHKLEGAARQLCFVHILLNAQEVTLEVRTCAGHDFNHYPEGYVEHNWQMYPIQARYFCYPCYNIGFL